MRIDPRFANATAPGAASSNIANPGKLDPTTAFGPGVGAAVGGIGGAIIGGLFGASGSAADRKNNRWLLERQLKYNVRAADKTYRRQKEFDKRAFIRQQKAILQAQGYQTSERELAQMWSAKQAKLAHRRDIQAESTRVQRLAADARAAGLHPLAAMGISATPGAAAPVSGGMTSPSMSVSASQAPQAAGAPGASPTGDRSLDGALAGANLGMGIAQAFDPLDRDLKRAQIANVKADTAARLLEAQSRTMGRKLEAATRGGATGSNTAPPVAGDRRRNSNMKAPRPMPREWYDVGTWGPGQEPLRIRKDQVTAATLEDLFGDVAAELASPTLISEIDKYSRSKGGSGVFFSKDTPKEKAKKQTRRPAEFEDTGLARWFRSRGY